jgi:hypothetical protein
MSADTIPTALDSALLCYCTDLTFGALRAACREGRWPIADKMQTGRLCTGCMGDLLHCLRLFSAEPPAAR